MAEERCNFCGKSKSAIAKLVMGPCATYICNECVELCCEILGHEGVKPFYPDTFDDVGPSRSN